MVDLTPEQKIHAIQLGHLVNVAYSMFGHDHNDLRPEPIGIPKKYKFIAWVQMADFFFEQDTFRFYGLIVQRVNEPNEFVLAIRGTATGLEWLDNLKAAVPISLQGFGKVAEGFDLIFKTMRVVKADGTLTDDFGTGMDFAAQVAAAVKSAPTPSGSTPSPAATERSIEVVGHSLGSALATLYVAKNDNAAQKLKISRLCTFASPRVGDADFASAFDSLKVETWRIVNRADIVPGVPLAAPLGQFADVKEEYAYPPGDVATNAPCAHRLSSYFHLLAPEDTRFKVDWDCDANAQHGPDWA